MLSLQRRKLLVKSEVFKQQRATSPEQAKNCTYEEQDGVDHPSVRSHFACGRQRSIFLKSRADRVLANNGGKRERNTRFANGMPAGCWGNGAKENDTL
jgi:hypothetical protein